MEHRHGPRCGKLFKEEGMVAADVQTTKTLKRTRVVDAGPGLD
jgi:hypothetical protein